MASANDPFIEKYSDMLSKSSKLGENGECQLWVGGTERRRNYVMGVINVSFLNGKRRKMNVARLSKMLALKNIEIDSNLDASHLCHNALCIRPEHINFERHSINNERRICVDNKICIHHGCQPDCMLQFKI